MKIINLLFILLSLVSFRANAQFMEYKSLPDPPPIEYIMPSVPNIEEKVNADRKRRLEMDILREQRDLLSNLNRNLAESSPSNLITVELLGASTSDLQFNFKSDWFKLQSNSKIVINKSTNRATLYIPELGQNLTYEILDLQIHKGEGYSVNTIQLESDRFISILNVYKENGLWVLWGEKGKSELVVFQAVK